MNNCDVNGSNYSEQSSSANTSLILNPWVELPSHSVAFLEAMGASQTHDPDAFVTILRYNHATKIAEIVADRSKYPLHYHIVWLSEVGKKGNLLGEFDINTMEMRLSESLLTTPKLLRDTIFHELAHVHAFAHKGEMGANHGKWFKSSWKELVRNFPSLKVQRLAHH